MTEVWQQSRLFSSNGDDHYPPASAFLSKAMLGKELNTKHDSTYWLMPSSIKPALQHLY